MSSNVLIDSSKLSETLKKELENYNRTIVDATKIEAKKAMDQLVRQTKATAPTGHRHKHYKNSITSKKEWESELGAGYIWYVKGSDYRLSHLLEFGHATKNGGRTRAFHFIQKASDPIIQSYITAIEEAIRNG